MDSWLLLLLVPLGGAAIGSLFDNLNDDDDDDGNDPQVVNNLDGVVSGTAGADTITATRDEVEATVRTSWLGDGFSWDNYFTGEPRWDWDTETAYPADETLPGLTVIDAGAGNDNISIGVSTHVDAGTGNDTISVETPQTNPETYTGESWERYVFASAVQAGAGDDLVTANGPNIAIEAGEGNDTVSASEAFMLWIKGGAGDDSLSGTHRDSGGRLPDGYDMEISGGTGNDTIEAEFLGSSSMPDLEDYVSFAGFANGGGGDDRLTVSGSDGVARGGEGNDSLTVSGAGMLVDGDAGADSLNIAGLSNSVVRLTAEDVLQGYADSENIDMRLSGVTQFQGTDGDDTIKSSTSISISGGAGDDVLGIADTNADETGRASTLVGGQGDDTLIGGALFYDTTASLHGNHGEIYWAEGDSNDLLIGGDGNDEITFDQADTVTGGSGNDTLFYSADAGSSAVVTDFTAGEDVLTITLNPQDVSLSRDSVENPPEITISESDGKTTISLSGSEILTLNGTGLNIGFGHGFTDLFGSEPYRRLVWTDLNGEEVDPDTLDVRIDALESRDF